MKSKEFAVTALLAALVCVLSPWAIPTGAVPLTLASFGVYLCGGLAGFRKGTAAVAVYLLLGGLKQLRDISLLQAALASY